MKSSTLVSTMILGATAAVAITAAVAQPVGSGNSGFRTTLRVHESDASDVVYGYLLREIRAVRDIRLVDLDDATLANPSTFDIDVKVRLLVRQGTNAGYMFSVVAIGPFDKVDIHILDFVPDKQGLQQACEEAIATIDSKLFEQMRKLQKRN